AIGTDAATVRDMAILKPAARQTIELFQWKSGRPVSLLRVPQGEAALRPLRSHEVRLARAGEDLVVTTAAQVAPLYASTNLDGSLVIASRLDLAESRSRLAQRLKGAALRGVDDGLPLVGAGANENADQTMALPVAEKGIPPLSLAVTFERRGGWTRP